MEMSRRTFIHSAAGSLFVLGSAPYLTNSLAEASSQTSLPKAIQLESIHDPKTEHDSREMPTALAPSDRVGFAIVGLGHLALEEILPAFAKTQRCKPIALVSGSADKAKKVADQYGIHPKNIYNYQNYDELKNNPEVQVIYIVLPNSMHKEFVIRGAQAGKHILCEKPMATSSAEAQAMIDACKKAGRHLMIAYRIQYAPHHRLLRKQIQEGKLGTVKAMSAVNGQNDANPSHWRMKRALAGGGSLPDVGIYCFNTERYLLGEEPIQVSAFTHSTPNDVRFKEVEEMVNFTLTFSSGVVTSNICSYGFHDSKGIHIFGTDASASMDPAFPYHGLKLKIKRKASETADSSEEIILPEKDQFTLELDHMAKCVLENTRPYTPGEEGLQDQRIIEAIYKSAELHQPVSLTRYEGRDVFRGPSPEV